MADPKDNKDYKNDPARTKPYTFEEPRPKEEIVAQAYDHEQPTPTQMEADQAKLAAISGGAIPEGGGDPQAAKKKELEAAQKPSTGGYQTRASTPPKAE